MRTATAAEQHTPAAKRFSGPDALLSNLTLRILTALVGVPLILGLTYLGGWPFALLLLFGALVSQYELYALMELGGLRPQKTVGLGLGALLAVQALVPMAFPLAVSAVLFLIALNPFREEQRPLPNLAATVFGAIYPTALLTFILHLRVARGPLVGDVEAFYLTVATFLLIWATDTFAYVFGRMFGRHPLAPAVSPKKTWEGAVGGAVGALAVAVGLKLTLLGFLAWPHVAVLALLTGAVSQMGDLAESKIKRSVGAKDSGTILPGHGGLLDRLDAMILSVPLVYLYLAYVALLFE